jgi:hypothetical protein
MRALFGFPDSEAHQAGEEVRVVRSTISGIQTN